MKTIKGETKTGFKFEIVQSKVDNFELFEELAEVENNPLLIPSVFKKVLGEEQLNELKEHLRTEEGNVPLEKMMVEIEDIFDAAGGDLKN